MIAFVKSVISGDDNPEPHNIDDVDSNDQIPTTKSQSDVKLLNQGAYGCVFRPGVNCSGKQLTTKKYITKVQSHRKTSTHETSIGKIIREIPGNSRYFAPVLETCDVKLSDLNNDTEVEKCKFIDTNANLRDKLYESNKIQYVGKNSLVEHFKLQTNKINKTSSYLKKLINSHTTLLRGVSKLNDANIIHFDMKENNVMCRDKSGHPVLIDFGMSINVENIATPEFPLAETFFTYGVTYGPWCIDIILINRLIGKTAQSGWRDEKPDSVDTKEVIQEYMDKNTGLLDILTVDQRNEYKKNVEGYIMQHIEGGLFNMPTRGIVYDELIKNVKSWDNYGTAIMYLMMLKLLNLTEYKTSIPFMEKYVNILTSVVLSTPDKRPTAHETMNEIKKAMTNIARKENVDASASLTKDFRNPDNWKARVEKTLSMKNASLHTDAQLVKLKNE